MIVRYPNEERLEPQKSKLAIWIEQLRPGWRILAPVLVIFVLSRLAFYAAAFFGYLFLPDPGQWPGKMVAHGPWWIAIPWRWDAIHYYNIVVGGYRPHPAAVGTLQSQPALLPAFFPLLPLLTRILATLASGLRPPALLPITNAEPSVLWAGVMVANCATLLAFWLLFQLTQDETGDRSTAQRAVLYLAIFPLAFYFYVPYAEILLLAASIGVFLSIGRGRWVSAGVWGALASAARPMGVLLLPALFLEIILSWRRGDLRRDAWPRAILGLLLMPVGLLFYMLYLWHTTGDALAFVHAQEYWHRTPVFPLLTLWRCIRYMFHPGDFMHPALYARDVLDTLIVVGFLSVLAVSWRRWRPGYSVYGLLLFTLMLTTPMHGELISEGMGRNAMVFFPVYIALARWGRRPTIHQTILMTWLPLFGILAALYARYYFLE